MQQLKIKIVAEDRYMPKYANDTDACMDLKARILHKTEFDIGPDPTFDPYTPDSITIHPGETVKIHTGVKVAVPESYVMKMYVRSSIGIKRNLCLANGTGIIDSGYRDEIIMAIHNFGNEPQDICDGDRLCQFIILPYPKLELEQVKDDKNFRTGDRGGGIGSTGK